MHDSQVNDIQAKLDEIFASARARFGHGVLFMEASGGEGGEGDGGAPAGDDGKPDGEETPADKGGDKPDAKDGDKGKPADGSKSYDEAYVKTLRDEAASHRTEKQQLKGVLDAINKALNPDAGEAEKVDPAKLQQQLTDTATAHTNLQREHQVLLSALAEKADHSALLDSRSFLGKVAELDPADEKFADKVTAAVKAAVKENPKLAAAPAAGKGGAELNGGSGEQQPRAKTLEDAINKKMAG